MREWHAIGMQDWKIYPKLQAQELIIRPVKWIRSINQLCNSSDTFVNITEGIFK